MQALVILRTLLRSTRGAQITKPTWICLSTHSHFIVALVTQLEIHTWSLNLTALRHCPLFFKYDLPRQNLLPTGCSHCRVLRS